MKITLKKIVWKKPLNAKRCATLIIDSLVSEVTSWTTILSNEEMIYLKEYQPKDSSEYNAYLAIYKESIDLYHRLLDTFHKVEKLYMLIKQRHNIYFRWIQHIEYLYLIESENKQPKWSLTNVYLHQIISNSEIWLSYSEDYNTISLEWSKESYLELIHEFNEWINNFKKIYAWISETMNTFPITFFVDFTNSLNAQIEAMHDEITCNANCLHNTYLFYTLWNKNESSIDLLYKSVEYDWFMNIE